ncbi:MAG: hypothetical protein R6X35_03370 [Candidatus Krumholzibacteriia bacterium]
MKVLIDGRCLANVAPEVRERIDWVGQNENPGELAGYYRRAGM